MKAFNYTDESIKKITPNQNEIAAIQISAKQRFYSFAQLRKNTAMSKYVFENLYEAIRELAECIALRDGLKIYSHEVTISYLLEKDAITDTLASRFDSFRKLRNKSKYYGKNISAETLQDCYNDLTQLQKLLLAALK